MQGEENQEDVSHKTVVKNTICKMKMKIKSVEIHAKSGIFKELVEQLSAVSEQFGQFWSAASREQLAEQAVWAIWSAASREQLAEQLRKQL